MQQDLGREAISFISSSDTGRKKKKKTQKKQRNKRQSCKHTRPLQSKIKRIKQIRRNTIYFLAYAILYFNCSALK